MVPEVFFCDDGLYALFVFRCDDSAGAAGAADYASTGIAVMKEFSGTVKGGSVIRETYDDDDNCEVVYELISRGLKKKVIGGVD